MPVTPLEVFISYAHADETLRKELEKHLSLLQQRKLITGWHDRQIPAGAEWEGEIDAHLNSAQIILLLISADFLASRYCYSIEMKRAFERHEAGEARVIPIILRPVDWEQEPSLHKLQALPTSAKAVTTWQTPPTYDEAFLDIARGIRKVVEEHGKHLIAATANATSVWNVPYRRNPYFTGQGSYPDSVGHHAQRQQRCHLDAAPGDQWPGGHRQDADRRLNTLTGTNTRTVPSCGYRLTPAMPSSPALLPWQSS